ncbi:hypothetical protein O988_05638 [Pseudogymnoascus sp. VKM F-3808]|nr:hypothetical protein O988_05638 [Pseudogymnoascus sp. VKM F-3808]
MGTSRVDGPVRLPDRPVAPGSTQYFCKICLDDVSRGGLYPGTENYLKVSMELRMDNGKLFEKECMEELFKQ